MRKILALAASLCFVASVAAAQAPSQSAASKSDLLSMDQKIKIAQLITKQAAPLASGAFSIAVDGIVPADIELHSLPAEAERLAPQVRRFGYIVVEEQIALVDQRTRKVELVFPRRGE
jgi:Protein of unknown function (DUF1236)